MPRIRFPFACLLFIPFFLMGCSVTRVYDFSMTASEAPEVHGANAEQKPHSSSWRFSGKVYKSVHENVVIREGLYSNGKEYEWRYEIGGNDFSGKADWFYKSRHFMIGTGVGYKDGLYHHGTVGVNTSHMELGAFLGLFHQYSDLEYTLENCETGWYEDEYDQLSYDPVRAGCNSSSDHHYRFSTSPFMGAFWALYFSKFYLNYNVSFYTPEPDVEGESLNVPSITSNYLNVGYRITRWLDYSVGAILTATDGNLIWGVSSGISFYLN